MPTQIDDTNASRPLTESEAAVRLGLKVATLRAWRSQGRGPVYIRLGRAVRYLASDIDDYLTSNRHTPRSNPQRRHLNASQIPVTPIDEQGAAREHRAGCRASEVNHG